MVWSYRVLYFQNDIFQLFSWNSQKLKIIMSGYLRPNFTQIDNKGGNNNNNSFYLLQLGCHPVAVIILHVHKYEKTRKYKSWGLHEKHVVAIMDRNSYCPSVKYSLHRADTKRTNTKWIFMDAAEFYWQWTKKIGPLIYTLPYSMLVTAHIYMELTVVGWITAEF